MLEFVHEATLRREVRMAGRKIRDVREARECLLEVARSGVNRVQWAREHGIDARSLNAWRVNLERSGPTDVLRLVELVPQRASSGAVSVRCGVFTVHVEEAFDERVLARVLAVVASC